MREFPPRGKKNFRIFRRLNSPAKVQDFIDGIVINFEEQGETCISPLEVLRRKKAHCMEGAMLAAAAFWYHGAPPLLLDLKTAGGDDDHVVALFRQEKYWGAVSKTNHAVLRYRDPIYKNIRELAMSYFNEYFLDDGAKTMREYSKPFNLLRYGTSWLTSPEDLWHIAADLDGSKHFGIVKDNIKKRLRRADKIEIDAGKLTEWKKKK